MTDPLSLVIIVITIGIIPTFIGMFFRVLMNKYKLESNTSQSVLKNISLGIMLALFVDFIVNSSQLGVNLGMNIYSITLLSCFIFGFIFIFLLSSLNSNFSYNLSLIHISEPTRQAEISYAVLCL